MTLDRPSMRFTRPWMIDRFGRLIQRTIAKNWWNQLYSVRWASKFQHIVGLQSKAGQPTAVTGNVRISSLVGGGGGGGKIRFVGRARPAFSVPRERTGFCGQVTNQRRATSRCAAHRLVDAVGPGSIISCGSTACRLLLLLGSDFFYFNFCFVVFMEISKSSSR
ncbi:hypothetical protein T4D_8807 [Trichinella pseudospiralis]|uniref:Uncharacterized protein n=1 Tax=Trichinella pseudospiralis TaxID=6337 RepID=A0A0V1FHQ4_TRIPS|nr:hypothetical protein T4D_8807 [Trichinella pseudospiralis]